MLRLDFRGGICCRLPLEHSRRPRLCTCTRLSPSRGSPSWSCRQCWSLTGRSALHRSVWMAGIALGTLLVYTAAQVALLQLARELRDGGPSPREFVATLLSLPLMVTAILAFGFANVSRPEIHKRLMMLATFVILTPALARIIQLLDSSLSRLMRNDLAGLASDALVVVAIAYDARRRGRVHPAYRVGGGCIVLVQTAVLAVRPTSFWYGITNWLASLAN